MFPIISAGLQSSVYGVLSSRYAQIRYAEVDSDSGQVRSTSAPVKLVQTAAMTVALTVMLEGILGGVCLPF